MIAASGAAWSCAGPGKSAPAQAAAEAKVASPKVEPRIPLPTVAESRPRDYPGILNAVAYHNDFVSGSAPEGDEGFETLAAMGVKTIISVDGIEPEVERAKAHGLKYIHLPIGYNGFDEQRKLELVRATSDAVKDGPVYIHCHHGKHRSAGAAASIAASMGWMTPTEGVERMKVSGTAPNYTGLFSCASQSQVLGANVIESVPASFPSVWKPSGYVKAMTEIDEAFDLLKEIEKAGWTTPQDQPDLVPVAEAGRLADLMRGLSQSDYAKHKPAELAAMMRDGQAKAQGLEDLLAAGEKDSGKMSAQFKLVAASCRDCHAKYRDVP